jgi:NADH dehydrogenase FAD-containing subunit
MQKDFASSSSILVVGGGPTGVEIIGELSEHVRQFPPSSLLHFQAKVSQIVPQSKEDYPRAWWILST